MEAGEQPRIAPGDRQEIGLVNYGLAKLIGLATGGQPPNIFTTVARNRVLFRRWFFFAAALMSRPKLPRRDTELVILRVAHNTGCEYERFHHEQLGRRFGLSEEEIARAGEGPAAAGWTPQQALLLRATDELHAGSQIGDEVWAGLRGWLDDRQLIELCMLVGHYQMMAGTLNALKVQPDPVPAGPRLPRWLSKG